MGSVSLNEDIISYVAEKTWDSFSLQLEEIEQVYITAQSSGGFRLVFLVGGHFIKYLPFNALGFAELLSYLGDVFSIDKGLISQASSASEGKVRIYSKMLPQNYSIVENLGSSDLSEGFLALGLGNKLISWDSSIEDYDYWDLLEAKVEKKDRLFRYPVIVGNFLVQKMKISTNYGHDDFPVLSYHFELSHIENSKESFHDFYSKFLPSIKKFSGSNSYKLQTRMSSGDLKLYAYYSLNSNRGFESNRTFVRITNHKDYSYLLPSFEYLGRIGNVLQLEKRVQIFSNYRKTRLLRRLSPELNEKVGLEPCIWRAEEVNSIIFSQEGLSYVFADSEIAGFQISNIRPARGQGGSSLFVWFSGEPSKGHVVFTGRYKDFDKLVAELEEMSGKKITFGQEYEDS